MSWVQRAWGGPFKAPPMVQPVSVGWVLLKVLETLWRLLLILCLSAAGIALALWLSERNPLGSQVRIELSSSDDCRAKGYPIHGTITNRSKKTLGEVDVQFRVYPQGRSEDVASYLTARHELRYVLRPHEQLGYCFAMPEVEEGSVGPYTIAADVTYASEVSADVPVSTDPLPPERVEPRGKGAVWWDKIQTIIVGGLSLALFLSGGFALVALGDRLFATQFQSKLLDNSKGQGGCLAVMLVGFLNALVVDAASYALDALGLGAWISSLDAWSRTNGYADGGIMLLTAVACQWPWLILAMLGARKQVDRPPAHG